MSSHFPYQQRALQGQAAQVQRWRVALFPPLVLDMSSTVATGWQENLVPEGGIYPLHPGKVFLAPFAPHVQLGPTFRLGYVGENASFWAGDSFLRGGAGVTSDAQFVWQVSPPLPIQEDGPSMGITPTAPGLYTIACSCTMANGASHTAYRYLKVYADRDHGYDAIVEVSSLQGQLSSGGWSCSMTFQQGQPQLAPYSGVLLYAEDVFSDDPAYTMETLGAGSDRYDPHVAMCGYVTTESSQRTYLAAPGTVNVQGSFALLQDLQINDIYFSASATLMSWGHFLTQISITDVIWHLLQDHTAYADWHDLTLAQNEQQFLHLTVGHGALWDALKATTDNEYFFLFVDKGGGLHAEPDRCMNGYTWWGSRYFLFPPDQANYTGDPFYLDQQSGQILEPPVHFSDVPWTDPADPTQAYDVASDYLSLQVAVRRRVNVSYVKLVASQAGGTLQSVATYPPDGTAGPSFPTSALGQWLVVTDKYIDDTLESWNWLWQAAYRLFLKGNAPFPTVELQALGRVAGLDLNDPFWVTGADPAGEATLRRAAYTVSSISFGLDFAKQTTQTTIQGDAMTYDGTTIPVPQYYPGTYAIYAQI